jgi:dCTP deaminase
MIFSDHDIITAHQSRRMRIFPFNFDLVQPASYDVTLQCYARMVGEEHPEKFETLTIEPKAFVLLSTVEVVTLPADIAAQVSGKSSLARMGLSIETAGWVDPGFSGQLTLEVLNTGPEAITLTAGQPVAQLVFMEMKSPALRPYGSAGLGSKYMDQRGPTASRSQPTGS